MAGTFVPIDDLSKHFSVSISTIRAWVRQGHIPKDTYIKVGNTYRFNIDAVATALTTKDEPTPSPSQEQEQVVSEGITISQSDNMYEIERTTPEYNIDDDI